MNRLQLATLLSWADENGIAGRKRLQKVVYFLQQMGCSLDCQFTLHHFGPYSRDVADTCDEMVSAGLVIEEGSPNMGATKYTYKLTSQTRELLNQASDSQLGDFRLLGERLIKENLWSLELGSTILYFYRQVDDWDVALSKACEFKNVSVENELSRKAFELVQQFEPRLAT